MMGTTTRTLKPPLPISLWALRVAFAVAALLATLASALAVFEMA